MDEGLRRVHVGPLPQSIPGGEHRVRSDVRLFEMVLTYPNEKGKTLGKRLVHEST